MDPELLAARLTKLERRILAWQLITLLAVGLSGFAVWWNLRVQREQLQPHPLRGTQLTIEEAGDSVTLSPHQLEFNGHAGGQATSVVRLGIGQGGAFVYLQRGTFGKLMFDVADDEAGLSFNAPGGARASLRVADDTPLGSTSGLNIDTKNAKASIELLEGPNVVRLGGTPGLANLTLGKRVLSSQPALDALVSKPAPPLPWARRLAVRFVPEEGIEPPT
jgi:hypothetical protein